MRDEKDATKDATIDTRSSTAVYYAWPEWPCRDIHVTLTHSSVW